MMRTTLAAMALLMTACGAADTTGLGGGEPIDGGQPMRTEGPVDFPDAPVPDPRLDGGQPDTPNSNISCPLGPRRVCQCPDGELGHAECVGNDYGPCVCPPQPPPPNRSDREILQWLREGIVGTWRGVRMDPWSPLTSAEFEFRADGTFRSSCSNARDYCNTLYWGNDDDTARPYALFDIRADGEGVGEIGLGFESGVQLTPMLSIYLSLDQRFLRFRIWRDSSQRHGPVIFELERVVP